MSRRVRAVLKLISNMDEHERADLRQELAGESSPEEWKRVWNDELAHRIEQIERGEVKLLSEEEFFADFLDDEAKGEAERTSR
jgi:hypothetical protein